MPGIAVIGVGGWGQNHARVFSYLKSEELINTLLLVDINKNRARKIASIFGVEWSLNFDDALKREDIDGIVIASPTKLHYEQGLKALEAGKHVLIEKPMTETAKQAKKLVSLAEEQNLIIMVGFLLRYSPAIQFAKNCYEEGEIGKILSVLGKRTSYWPNRPMDVGVIRDLAIHDIDLIRFITKRDPKYVIARGGALKHDYEDYASIFLEYGSEKEDDVIHALLEANWVTPFKIRRMEITGENAVLIIDFLEHSVVILREDGIFRPNLVQIEPLYLEDKNFVLSIDRKDIPLVTGADGVMALKACEAALKSLNSGSIEEIDNRV